MYRLYAMSSPNVVKVTLLLEELEQDYDLQWVNVFGGEQHEDWFRALNPNGKVPVLAEPRTGGDFTLFESGAIMQWLADKHGAFGGATPDEQALVRQWLTFQMAGAGPTFGQAIHFTHVTTECPYGGRRFTIEMRRQLAVIEKRLAEVPFLAGEYSIADMALWPWIRTLAMFFADDLKTPSLRRWYETVGARDGVVRAAERMQPLQEQDGAARKAASTADIDRYFGRIAP